MKIRWFHFGLTLAACTHTDGYNVRGESQGPRTSGPDVQLTYNADQDYWPTWTQDGAAVLYAFVDPGSARHRCVGLLPAAGGSRIWEMCHNQATYDDSSSSFPAYALGADGRLLYVEAVTPFVPGIPAGSQAAPFEMTLWLADTAAPFRRTPLLALPLFVDGSSISWLGDLAWTGPNSFIALGQSYAIVRHCFGTGFPANPACDAYDTVLSSGTSAAGSGVVVRGTIVNGQATLTAVTGTVGATAFSLAEAGASIVFTRRDDNVLYKVAAGGGTVTAVGQASSTQFPANQLVGVSCLGSTCIVATDSVTLTRLEPTKIFPVLNGGARELRRISLVTGTSTTMASFAETISAPQLSMRGGDLVLQIGGIWGHLQTYQGSTQSDLHLLKAVVP